MIKVTVNINGMNYNLKGEKDEKYLLGVANYVDGRIKEIISKKENLSTTAATVLAAVNIADEFYECDLELDEANKLRETVNDENILLKQKLEKINLELENVLKEKLNAQNNFGKKETELHEKHKDVEVTFNSLNDAINNLKAENEKLKKENRLISDEAKKNKKLNEGLNKEIIEIKDKNKLVYKKIDEAKNKEYRLNKQLQQASDQIITLTNEISNIN